MEFAGLVVADDLTGAMDTGNEFAGRGYATTVALDGEVRDPDATVAVVDTDSRYSSASAAARAVAAAVESHPADVVYKKVDSTLRGNLVAEIDAAVSAAGADLAVVAPAFPANGRTTEDGVHRVNGTPVTETAAGQDPEKGVRTARLPALLESSAYPVVHLPLDRVADGSAAVATALADAVNRHGTAVVACDATRDDHLAAVAAGAVESGRDVVYVGSAGLARHVDVPGGKRDASREIGRRPHAPSRVLGVAGSTNPTTVEQVEAVAREVRVDLDLRRSVLDSTGAADEAAERCLGLLREEGTALLTTVCADPDAALQAGRERGVPEREVRSRISRTLGRTVRRVHRNVGVTGLFLTGGAVAHDVLGALGTDGIELTGESVGAGVPLGRLGGGEADGVPVVTKAGAFGDPGTIPNCLASLRPDDE